MLINPLNTSYLKTRLVVISPVRNIYLEIVPSCLQRITLKTQDKVCYCGN